jgi:MFS family permease
MTSALPQQSEFRRGWPVVFAAAIGYGTGAAALPFYTLGTFMEPLTQAFGWTRAEISLATFFTLAASLVALPYVGRLADRIGARRVAIGSMALTAFAFLSYTAMSGSIWVFYGLWFLMMVMGAGTSPAVWMRGVVSWFQVRRGLAIGLVMLGGGLASVVAPPAVDAAIRASGWWGGYVVLAGLTALVGLPVAVMAFREAPPGPTESDQSRVVQSGYDLKQAARSRTFWQLCLTMLLTGATISAFIVHLVPLLTDDGIARATAISMASLLGFAIIVGRAFVGWLVDLVFAPFVAAALFFGSTVALVLLVVGGTHSSVLLYGAVILIGCSMGAEADLVTYLVSRYFGMRAFSEVCAWVIVAFTIGQGLGPLGAAMVREAAGSYRLVLILGSVGLAVSVLLFATLGRYPSGFPEGRESGELHA